MADKGDILFPHKPCQKKIAGGKIRMPPLDHHHVGPFASDIARRFDDIKRVRRVKQVFRLFDLKTVVAVIPLFLMKKEFRVLHLVGDHLHVILFCQLPAHETRVMGYTAFVRIHGADQNNIFFHFPPSPVFNLYSE